MRGVGIKYITFIGAIALVALLLAACAPAAQAPKPEEKAATPVKQKPQYGGVFRTTTSNPRIGQDPHRTTGSSHFGSFGRAYSNLLRFKIAEDIPETTQIIAPDLAERWESPNPTTWIFYIRKGVKWHNIPPVNGREFTADDVVYSVNRLAGPGSAQRGFWQDLDKVEALDKYTVKFTLKGPVAPFLTIVAYGFNKMVAKEAIDAGGGNVDNGPLIGTGPWFVTCTVDIECVLKRNPDFFLKDEDGNQLPYLDEMRLAVIADVQAIFASFRAKQLDIYGVTVDERNILERSNPEVGYIESKAFAPLLYHFRNDKPPWNDERVRMAVSKAINRQEIIDTIWGGRGWFQLGWAAPGEDWYLPQEEYKQAFKQDIDLAKKLLAEAGYPNGLDASLWCGNYGATYVPTCELLAAQMAKAGIRIKINVHDIPTYLSKVYTRDGQFEDMSYGPQGTTMDPDLWLSDYYHSKGSRNSGHVKDPKLDQMIEAQRREMDPQKRKQMILDIQRYLLQKNYGTTTLASLSMTAIWPWVKNHSVSAAGDYPGYRIQDHTWIDQELKKKMGARE